MCHLYYIRRLVNKQTNSTNRTDKSWPEEKTALGPDLSEFKACWQIRLYLSAKNRVLELSPRKKSIWDKISFPLLFKVLCSVARSLQPVMWEGSHRNSAEGILLDIMDLCLWKEGDYRRQCPFLDAESVHSLNQKDICMHKIVRTEKDVQIIRNIRGSF